MFPTVLFWLLTAAAFSLALRSNRYPKHSSLRDTWLGTGFAVFGLALACGSYRWFISEVRAGAPHYESSALLAAGIIAVVIGVAALRRGTSRIRSAPPRSHHPSKAA